MTECSAVVSADLSAQAGYELVPGVAGEYDDDPVVQIVRTPNPDFPEIVEETFRRRPVIPPPPPTPPIRVARRKEISGRRRASPSMRC